MTHSLLRMGLFLLLATITLHAGINQWTTIGPDGATVVQLVRAPSNPTVLYALCLPAVVYCSRDGGLHWKMIRELRSNWTSTNGKIVVDPYDSETLYLLFSGELSKTTDGGGTLGKEIILPERQLFLLHVYSSRSSQPTNRLRFDRKQPFKIVGQGRKLVSNIYR